MTSDAVAWLRESLTVASVRLASISRSCCIEVVRRTVGMNTDCRKGSSCISPVRSQFSQKIAHTRRTQEHACTGMPVQLSRGIVLARETMQPVKPVGSVIQDTARSTTGAERCSIWPSIYVHGPTKQLDHVQRRYMQTSAMCRPTKCNLRSSQCAMQACESSPGCTLQG